MYFKSLEIVGFKSFYNKTVLDFEPGMTAVVGPNGCGKSNIFDAIRWVLGEQSVKALRGSEMQDVIFNGTETKEQLGMAEVSLVFDNDKKYFAVDHPEVAITRRLFRSGESEYLINKSQVRLKDILDLLMDTGIGAESYSLIQQGKIDLVLSSRPEDRRLVFDEAAGISKYKAQKRESMRRLDETEQNLLRVNDIVTEVKRQIGSLERQANKARRYKEVFEELKVKEIALASVQKRTLQEEKDKTTKDLNELQAREGDLTTSIIEQEARISNRQMEMRKLEEEIMGLKNDILNSDNVVLRSNERIAFDKEKIAESEAALEHMTMQAEQTKKRLALDEEKLTGLEREHAEIETHIAEKSRLLQDKEIKLRDLNLAVKNALEAIASFKRTILDIATKIANTKNEIIESTAQKQIYAARKKRLELERAKVNEDYATAENSLVETTREVEALEGNFSDLAQTISQSRNAIETQRISLEECGRAIDELEKERLTLQSQKEFLELLKNKYDTIGESMSAMIYLDKAPREKLNGLLIKIKEYAAEGNETTQALQVKITGEAKPIDLDTTRITENIARLEAGIADKNAELANTQAAVTSLAGQLQALSEDARSQELNLADKKAYQRNIQEHCDRIKNEGELIHLELVDVEEGLIAYEKKLEDSRVCLAQYETEQKNVEESITKEQGAILLHNGEKEQALMAITQTRTELEALHTRIERDLGTLKIVQDQYRQDKDALDNLQQQIGETARKRESLESEILSLEGESIAAQGSLQEYTMSLKETQGAYEEISHSASDVAKIIEADRASLEKLRNSLHSLQMRNKDIDFKYMSIKERILQGYKVDLDDPLTDITTEAEEGVLTQEIRGLKEKLDSYGNVNLVAIEEYDELKKRYDFLTQQQNDLVSAKSALLEAIQKINRTTKKMFIDTFDRVREEFRNYFRLLFNGGDCQVFLIDEQDPLESGIEIICRPPGKKLQNILLLSGGEKALAAIALIFAIFKVKPAPFCVLDEIDAALDEANVDRFGRLLAEFTKESQFIVITHNKKTIANADVMYGITMEESGVSKIVSVKFGQAKKNKEPQPVAEPV